MIAPSYFLGSQRIDQLHREADQARLAGLARLARRQRRHIVQTRCAAVPGVLGPMVISAFGNADGNVLPARTGSSTSRPSLIVHIANQLLTRGVGMKVSDMNLVLASQLMGELGRQAERRRLATHAPARKGRTAMLTQHNHTPGTFDAGHCRACAHEAGLLDHYDRVQWEETRLRQTWAWACAARRYAIWALCSSGGGILLAAVAILTR